MPKRPATFQLTKDDAERCLLNNTPFDKAGQDDEFDGSDYPGDDKLDNDDFTSDPKRKIFRIRRTIPVPNISGFQVETRKHRVVEKANEKSINLQSVTEINSTASEVCPIPTPAGEEPQEKPNNITSTIVSINVAGDADKCSELPESGSCQPSYSTTAATRSNSHVTDLCTVEDNVTGKIDPKSKSIFANPFLNIAKQGGASTFLQSGTSILPNSNPVSSNTASHDFNAINEDSLATKMPLSFPGEEDESEVFVCSSITLLKSVFVSVPVVDEQADTKKNLAAVAKTPESSDTGAVNDTVTPTASDDFAREGHSASTESCAKTTSELTAPSVGMTSPTVKTEQRYRKCGDGSLKILTRKESPAATTLNSRLVMRQKGTWSVLLNSPLFVSSTFTPVDLASGFALKFLAVDSTTDVGSKSPGGQPKSSSLDSSKCTFGAFCIKFRAKATRQEFLDAVAQLSSHSANDV